MKKYIVFECNEGFAVDIKALPDEIARQLGTKAVVVNDWVSLPRVVVAAEKGEARTVTVDNGALNCYALTRWDYSEQGYELSANIDVGVLMADWTEDGKPDIWQPQQWEP